jgi:hypothetical protein
LQGRLGTDHSFGSTSPTILPPTAFNDAPDSSASV